MKANRISGAFSNFTDRVGDKWVDFRDVVSGALTNATQSFRKYKRTRLAPPKRGDRHESANLVESGRKYYNDKRYHKSERYFRKAVATDESYARAHYYLGLSLYQINMKSAAKTAWTRATEVEPESEAAEKARRKLEKKLVYRDKSAAKLRGQSKRGAS